MARLLFGVTGGIAAYKMLETARLAIRAGHAVRVVQTPSSRRFVGVSSFAGITGAPVLVSEFEDDPLRGAWPGDPAPERAPIAHLALVENADLYLIAPASANTLAKLAHGHADSLLTTAALAAACPVAVAPAMNNRMWDHPAVQANVGLLRRHGVTVIGPGFGALASHGEHGAGRMTEPAELLDTVTSLLADRARPRPAPAADRWRGVRVLITAGGTQEPIDSVRYIGNRSSGRMGWAIAARAAARGAVVTLVAANVDLPAPPGVDVVPVRTAAELGAACAERFPGSDVLVMAAAVADFRPRDARMGKIKKDGGPPEVALEPTEDILSALAARRRPEQILVGFAAEHGDDAIPLGREKLTRKGIDAIVVNDVSQPGIGFHAAENEVTVLRVGGVSRHLARASKERIADGVLDEIDALRAGSDTSDHQGSDASGHERPGQPRDERDHEKENDDRAARADADRTARV